MCFNQKQTLFLALLITAFACQGVNDSNVFTNLNGDQIVFGAEKCDGYDNDKDGQIDEDFDNDKDGFPTCDVGSKKHDCDDQDNKLSPLAGEDCEDAVDNDCDDKIDQADSDCDAACGAQSFTCDKTQGVCENIKAKCIAGTPVCEYGIHPQYQVNELFCNDGNDNDCDGLTDIDDTDCQQFGSCNAGSAAPECKILSTAVSDGVCKGHLMECIDGYWNCNFGIIPNFQSFENDIDNLDNDCDGQVDEEDKTFGGSDSCPKIGQNQTSCDQGKCWINQGQLYGFSQVFECVPTKPVFYAEGLICPDGYTGSPLVCLTDSECKKDYLPSTAVCKLDDITNEKHCFNSDATKVQIRKCKADDAQIIYGEATCHKDFNKVAYTCSASPTGPTGCGTSGKECCVDGFGAKTVCTDGSKCDSGTCKLQPTTTTNTSCGTSDKECCVDGFGAKTVCTDGSKCDSGTCKLQPTTTTNQCGHIGEKCCDKPISEFEGTCKYGLACYSEGYDAGTCVEATGKCVNPAGDCSIKTLAQCIGGNTWTQGATCVIPCKSRQCPADNNGAKWPVGNTPTCGNNNKMWQCQCADPNADKNPELKDVGVCSTNNTCTCTGKTCGADNGCGQACAEGSGCSTNTGGTCATPGSCDGTPYNQTKCDTATGVSWICKRCDSTNSGWWENNGTCTGNTGTTTGADNCPNGTGANAVCCASSTPCGGTTATRGQCSGTYRCGCWFNNAYPSFDPGHGC